MRRLALAIALACLLSAVTRAGEMHPTGAVAQPTPSSATVAGEIRSTGAVAQPQASSTVLTIILTLISIVR